MKDRAGEVGLTNHAELNQARQNGEELLGRSLPALEGKSGRGPAGNVVGPADCDYSAVL